VVRDALTAGGIELRTRGDFDLDLAPSVENVLALGLREAVTNVLRHARANSVVAQIESEAGGVSLSVIDDGVGPGSGEGSGIQGMRDRVTAAGGVLRFGPGPAGGTEVRIDMPFGGRGS
jgi:signal transduction histidine kinase